MNVHGVVDTAHDVGRGAEHQIRGEPAAVADDPQIASFRTSAVLKAAILAVLSTSIIFGASQFDAIPPVVSSETTSTDSRSTLPVIFVVIFGFAQTGKSWFKNAIDPNVENAAATGNGNGLPKTNRSTVYSMRFDANAEYNIPHAFEMRMMDTRGLFDITLDLSDEEALQEIVFALSQIPETAQMYALMTESLLGDQVRLVSKRGDGSLNILTSVLGEDVLRSTSVIGTKPLVAAQAGQGNREQTVKTICEQLPVRYLTYESNRSLDYGGQFGRFMQLFFGDSALEPLDLAQQVSKTKQEIEHIKQQLMRDTPKKKVKESYVDGHYCKTDFKVLGVRIRDDCGHPIWKIRWVEIPHDEEEFRLKAIAEYKKLHRIVVDFDAAAASTAECEA